MKISLGKPFYTDENKPDTTSYTLIKEPNIGIQLISYFLIAMLSIGYIILLKKWVFHIKVRSAFAPEEISFAFMPAIWAIITVFFVRYLLKCGLLFALTKGENTTFGFSIKPPSFICATTKPLSKLKMILFFILPFLITTIIALFIHKDMGNRARYYWQFLPYVSALFACSDLYNTFLIAIKTPSKKKILQWKQQFWEETTESNPT